MELDTTKLVQAGQRKLTPHDNCTVLDLDLLGVGSSVYPRIIEIRIPGIDGARQSALWDGAIDLAVDDSIVADEYAGQTIWRISSMGGGDSGAGKQRVNKVWASDFSSESLVTDVSDNVTINTGTLTLPSDVIHLGDVDTKLSFTDDDVEITVGGLSMLKLTETAQDLITMGSGSGDIDINFNGQMFLQGSTGNLGIGTVLPSNNLTVAGPVAFGTFQRHVASSPGGGFALAHSRNTTVGSHTILQNNDEMGKFIFQGSDGTAFRPGGQIVCLVDGTPGASDMPGRLSLRTTPDGTITPVERMKINNAGLIKVGTGTVSAQLHVDQSSSTAARPVLLLDQADVSEEMIEFVSTVGTGNAIEAVGAKVLTTTHFIKVTLPGALTRYIPVGTIA